MRFLCLLVMFVSIILSGILGFLTYNDARSIEKMDSEISDYVTQQVKWQADIDAMAPQLAEYTAQKTELETEIAALKKRVIYKTKPTAFLTFDDGTSYNTIKILDILKQYDVKATFFVVGTQILGGSEASKTAIQRIVDEGHQLAIHAYEHEYSKIYSSADAYFEDFEKIRTLLKNMTGYETNIVRLPSGTASARSFCGTYSGTTDTYYDIVSRLYEMGYTVIDWNVETKDYTTSTGVNQIIKNALDGAEARLSKEWKAAVVLMHDTADTVAALPSIIEGIQNLGMDFETIVQGGYVTRQIAETSKP